MENYIFISYFGLSFPLAKKLIEEGKNDVTLTTLSARNRNKAICEYYLASNDMDIYFKRSIKIAYAIFDGYKIRHTMLSIATMEKLIKLPKDVVNDVFSNSDIEDYIEANYGIKMNIVDGNITDGYRIMDEKKYLIFLLKYQ